MGHWEYPYGLYGAYYGYEVYEPSTGTPRKKTTNHHNVSNHRGSNHYGSSSGHHSGTTHYGGNYHTTQHQYNSGSTVRSSDSGNICGNSQCGSSFICAADYNRRVQPQGAPGVVPQAQQQQSYSSWGGCRR